jgi:hypothetical protein
MKIFPTKASWSYKLSKFMWGKYGIPSNICWYFLQTVFNVFVWLHVALAIVGFITLFYIGFTTTWLGMEVHGDLYPIEDFITMLGLPGLTIQVVIALSGLWGYIAGLISVVALLAAAVSYAIWYLIKLQFIKDIFRWFGGFSGWDKLGNWISNLKAPLWLTKTCQLCKDIDFETGKIKEDK